MTLDDDGWYEKIQLHYFLTIGRSFLADRDTQVAQKLIQNGNGSLFIPDFNISQLGAVVGTMFIAAKKQHYYRILTNMFSSIN